MSKYYLMRKVDDDGRVTYPLYLDPIFWGMIGVILVLGFCIWRAL
jgi:hypothetical protein